MERAARHARLEAGCAAVGMAAMLLCAPSCGAKGPPRPPPPREPEPVRGLELRQEGDGLTVSFKPPVKNEDASPLVPPVSLEILVFVSERPAAQEGQPPVGGPPVPAAALTAPASAAPAVSRREAAVLMRRARPVKVVPLVGAPSRVDVRLGPEDFPGMRLEASRVIVGVAVVDGRHRRTSPSSVRSIDPAPGLPAPRSLAAVPTPEGVRVAWEPPDGVCPPDSSFALYRWKAGEPLPSRPLALLPAGEREFLDREAPAGSRLAYGLRLALMPAEPRRESLMAGPVEIDVRDVFAPTAPEGLVAVVEADGIRLFWYPSPEADVAGYRLYRAEEGESGFKPLFTEPTVLTSHEDRAVQRGRKYEYRVTALDGATPPNESAPSQAVSGIAGSGPAGEPESR